MDQGHQGIVCLEKHEANEESLGIVHSLMKSSCPQTLTERKWRTPKASLEHWAGKESQRADLKADRWIGRGSPSTASVGNPVFLQRK